MTLTEFVNQIKAKTSSDPILLALFEVFVLQGEALKILSSASRMEHSPLSTIESLEQTIQIMGRTAAGALQQSRKLMETADRGQQ